MSSSIPRLSRAARVAAWLLVAAAIAWPARAQTIRELPLADTARAGAFGVTVAADGRRALVGASGESVCGANAGAAYVFEQDAEGAWHQAARLVPSTCRPGAFFGRALALSGDRALVGASVDFFAEARANVAYLFRRDTAGVWREVDRLTVDPGAAEGAFAASVALDGDRALVTTQGDPARRERTARPDGAAYVFERDARTGRWRQAARLHGRAGGAGVFGADGALDGDRAVVAAAPYAKRRPGAAYVFERGADGAWREAAYLGGIQSYFLAVALDGDRLLVGAAQAGRRQEGRAFVYARNAATGRWERAATLRPRTPYASGAFGSAVSLDGARALVTGYDEQLGHDFNIDRVVYVFAREKEEGAWRQERIIDIGEVDFATAIALSGAVAVIGHAPDGQPGAAYVVRLR